MSNGKIDVLDIYTPLFLFQRYFHGMFWYAHDINRWQSKGEKARKHALHDKFRAGVLSDSSQGGTCDFVFLHRIL